MNMDWKQAASDRFSLAKDANKWADLYRDSAANIEATMFKQRRDFTVNYVLTDVSPHAQVLDLGCGAGPVLGPLQQAGMNCIGIDYSVDMLRSEEHTSELQSRGHLVCRLLLDKKNRMLSCLMHVFY